MGAGGSDSRFDPSRQPQAPVQGPPHRYTETDRDGNTFSMTKQANGMTTGVQHGYFEAMKAAEDEAWENGSHYGDRD
jgi:hypothetical protein